jgi:hypothetical protein
LYLEDKLANTEKILSSFLEGKETYLEHLKDKFPDRVK